MDRPLDRGSLPLNVSPFKVSMLFSMFWACVSSFCLWIRLGLHSFGEGPVSIKRVRPQHDLVHPVACFFIVLSMVRASSSWFGLWRWLGFFLSPVHRFHSSRRKQFLRAKSSRARDWNPRALLFPLFTLSGDLLGDGLTQNQRF